MARNPFYRATASLPSAAIMNRLVLVVTQFLQDHNDRLDIPDPELIDLDPVLKSPAVFQAVRTKIGF